MSTIDCTKQSSKEAETSGSLINAPPVSHKQLREHLQM